MATEKTAAPQTQPPIAIWRERMGYSIEDAAKELDVPSTTIMDYESGAQPTPRHIALAMAALALGLSPFEGK